ncbi:MAG: NUDIX hydrolase [Tissierellia bacterium]|jgi:8-oxo-dGTP pyrophosphatase MutT (NUDIX family)|nr:NUDIX hydrolase [Tissierellia bacterium]
MIISAGGVVIQDNKVLLLHTKNDRWVLPKGHVEPEESLRQAAVREVFEEAGIHARIERKLGWVYYEFVFQGRNLKKKVLWFQMKLIEGDLKPQREEGFIDARFLAWEDLDHKKMHHNEVHMIRKALA